jgi:uncharacterized NAD-dependent epimerase/dehydratase family protein
VCHHRLQITFTIESCYPHCCIFGLASTWTLVDDHSSPTRVQGLNPMTNAASRSAIVLANNHYQTPNGKTAHGLVRGSERFDVKAVIDPCCAGPDAGEILDGVNRGIPLVSSMAEALSTAAAPVSWCVVGIATHGGRFEEPIRALILEAIDNGLSIVNGLHDTCSDDEEIVIAARANKVELIDLHKGKPKSQLHFWQGDIYKVRAPRLAVMGTDCALGKRTTTRMLTQALVDADIDAQMIYTGQTGWMQGARFGVVFDSIINDYVSGELEHAIINCDHELQPDIMIIEGQSSLRNPSGPCGSELLLSAVAKAMVLQHAPAREYFDGYESLGLRIPSVASEIELIAMYGAKVIAVTLNEEHADDTQMRAHQAQLGDELGIPVVRPLVDGLTALVPSMRDFIEQGT